MVYPYRIHILFIYAQEYFLQPLSGAGFEFWGKFGERTRGKGLPSDETYRIEEWRGEAFAVKADGWVQPPL
jgi:hypothetical protein